MRVRLKFFAAYREAIGKSELEIEVAEGTTAGQVLAGLVRDNPRLEKLSLSSMVAVNQEYVGAGAELAEGDVVVFVPPVSGGQDAI